MNIPSFIPSPPRRSHRRAKSPETASAVLTLVAATYVAGETLTLVFNQPIDIGAYNGEAVFVDDGPATGLSWLANGASELIAPTTLRVELTAFESTEAGPSLTAPDSTGLVAATSGGATWAGVNGLALPFG